MGCGTSKPTFVEADDDRAGTSRKWRRSVTVAEDSTPSTNRGSIDSAGACASGVYQPSCGDPSYVDVPDDVKHTLDAIILALEINDIDVERSRLETHRRREAEAAKAAAAPVTSTRERRIAAQREIERPPTPTGYVAEEPSPESVAVQSAVESMRKKFSNFFSPSATVAEDTADIVQALKGTPEKYSKGEGSVSDFGSTYQYSIHASASGSIASLGTRASALDNGDAPIDEKVMKRVAEWTTDHIGVVVRVVEVLRRKMQRAKALGDLPIEGERTTSSGSVSSKDRSSSCFSDGTFDASGFVSRLFVPTLSPNPVEVYERRIVPELLSSHDDASSAANPSVVGDVETSPGTISLSRRAPPQAVWNKQENFLCKRNLDKLQDKLAAAAASVPAPQPSAINGEVSVPDATKPDEIVNQEPVTASPANDLGASPQPLKRANSRYDDSLLFQELV